jgi:hypothetical protein
MKPLSLLQIFRPMIILSKIAGTYPFKIHKSNLVFCRIKLLYSIVCLSIYVTLVSLFFISALHKFASDKILIIMISIKCFGCTAVTLAIIFSSFVNHKKMFNVIRNISEIDAELIRFGQEERIARSSYHHRRLLIILMSINLLYNIVGDCFVGLTKRHNSVEFFAMFTYPRTVVNNMNIVYCVMAIIVEERFKIVNDMFYKLTVRSRRFKFRVSKLVIIHRLLVKNCQQLNSVYSLQLLLWITQCFVLSLTDLHLGIFSILFKTLSSDFQSIFISVKNCTIYLFNLYYLAKRSARLSFQVIQNN